MLSIGCDAHKRYSQFEAQNRVGKVVDRTKVMHDRGAILEYLARYPEGTPVALESVGNWYWIADEPALGARARDRGGRRYPAPHPRCQSKGDDASCRQDGQARRQQLGYSPAKWHTAPSWPATPSCVN
jgi:hypothetical protein